MKLRGPRIFLDKNSILRPGALTFKTNGPLWGPPRAVGRQDGRANGKAQEESTLTIRPMMIIVAVGGGCFLHHPQVRYINLINLKNVRESERIKGYEEEHRYWELNMRPFILVSDREWYYCTKLTLLVVTVSVKIEDNYVCFGCIHSRIFF